jgi:hypothetical protein
MKAHQDSAHHSGRILKAHSSELHFTTIKYISSFAGRAPGQNKYMGKTTLSFLINTFTLRKMNLWNCGVQ